MNTVNERSQIKRLFSNTLLHDEQIGKPAGLGKPTSPLEHVTVVRDMFVSARTRETVQEKRRWLSEECSEFR